MSEEQLVTAICSVFAGDVPNRQWVWIPEFGSSNGVADLAAVQLCPKWRASAQIGAIPARWTYLLKCLPLNEPFTVATLSAMANVTVQSARSALYVYQGAGFCESDSTAGTWMKIRELTPIARRIIAIEAKLYDWRRALAQASRYTDYATEAWVVVPDAALSAAYLDIDDFSYRGIGLLGLSCTGEFTVACAATERAPRLPNRYWQANSEIAKRLQNSALEIAPVESIQAI